MSFSGTKGRNTKPKPGVQINPSHPLSRGLVGYWLFNEGAGSLANDISGNKNHGRLTNMSPNVQGSGWSGSKFGGGLKFDGVNNYVDIGDVAVVEGIEEITINTFIIPDVSHTAYEFIVSKGQYDPAISPYNVWALRYNDNNQIRFEITNSSNTRIITVGTTSIPLNISTKISAVYNGIDLRIYINGILDNIPTAQTGTIDISTGNLVVGAVSNGLYNFFNGIIDSVCVYNRALSAAEIKQLYHDPFCNLLQVPIRRYSVAAPPVGAIMNHFQKSNIGADLYNGVLA